MDRYEKARDYHKRGFNCCQSVLASFTDLTGMSEQECFDIAGGFGAGAGTGELCGAITGAAMTLGRLTPVDPADPVGSKNGRWRCPRSCRPSFLRSSARCAARTCWAAGNSFPMSGRPRRPAWA